MKQVRCAIYTRKSSEEGLEQDFNSLDAQREACAAYVMSQASEGWLLLPAIYDDGGLSGGTLERPALQRLLADVALGAVDIIAVYKVDRLTRSLLDFAKLVEALDKAGTSFVSITQSFNTTTSMGRLTLNMLLSFAQFEREVTAERIRDKIAASKAKGMWMGGIPPLGYRPDGRSLAIEDDHAELVQQIYARYLELGTVRRLAEWLDAGNILTPVRQTGTGKTFGGAHFSRGQLYSVLRNPVYAGDIRHGPRVYPGNHPAIIERAMWNAVQQQLASHIKGARDVRLASASLLAGKLFDGAGEQLIAVHTAKPGNDPSGARRRYRYYVSKAAHHGTSGNAPSLRIPARDIERLVASEVAGLFRDPIVLAARCGLCLPPPRMAAIVQQCERLAMTVGSDDIRLRELIAKVRLRDHTIVIEVVIAGIARLLSLDPPAETEATIQIQCAVQLARTGRAVRLVQPGGGLAVQDYPDRTVVRLIARARAWWAVLAAGEADIKALASTEQLSPSYVTRVVRLAFLAPEVVEAALRGGLRGSIDGAALLATDAVPESWNEQAQRFLPG